MQEIYGAARLARFIPWFPVVYIEATKNTAQTAEVIAIDLVIKNTRTRPILIRSIAVQLPRDCRVGRFFLGGDLPEKQLSMLRGLDSPANLTIRPGAELRLQLLFDPVDGMDLHISWRSKGMRLWPCVPMNVRRSRQALLDECNVANVGTGKTWHGEW